MSAAVMARQQRSHVDKLYRQLSACWVVRRDELFEGLGVALTLSAEASVAANATLQPTLTQS